MALAPISETPLLFVQPPSPAINGFVSVSQRCLCQGFVADRSSEDFPCAWENVGLRRGRETIHVTKTGHLRAVQMHLHLAILVCTANNFRLCIQGLFSHCTKALLPVLWCEKPSPPADSKSFSPDFELASLYPSTSLRTGYFPPSLSISVFGS